MPHTCPSTQIPQALVVTQAHLDALDVAIASATLSVRLDNREYVYKSTGQMLLARNHIAQVLASKKMQLDKCAMRRRFSVSYK